jgi:hypothetical protein
MRNRLKYGVVCLVLIAFALLLSADLRADVTGSVLGVVHDRSQAVVAGAKVVATNVQTNFEAQVTSLGSRWRNPDGWQQRPTN